jgi:hypothetical protein
MSSAHDELGVDREVSHLIYVTKIPGLPLTLLKICNSPHNYILP